MISKISDQNYVTAQLAGCQVCGSQAGHDKIVHWVRFIKETGRTYSPALCGRYPLRKSAGFSTDEEAAPTCLVCIKKMSRLKRE